MSNYLFEVDECLGNGAKNPITFDLSDNNKQNEFGQVGKGKANKGKKNIKKNDYVKPDKVSKPKKPKKLLSFVSNEVLVESHRITLTLPIYTVSEANSFEKWQVKNERHKTQKALVRFSLLPFQGKIPLPCNITLHRIAPRELDAFENLPMSQKWIADSVADFLIPGLKPGRADADTRIVFRATQEKCEHYGIKIIFEF